jgi:hypothetical protein
VNISNSLARPFIVDGKPATIWEADEWATARGEHIDAICPDGCVIADRYHGFDGRKRGVSIHNAEQRRHVLALLETGHAAHEVAQFFGATPDHIRNIDNARRRRRGKP